jgi:hypothetical protein
VGDKWKILGSKLQEQQYLILTTTVHIKKYRFAMLSTNIANDWGIVKQQ